MVLRAKGAADEEGKGEEIEREKRVVIEDDEENALGGEKSKGVGAEGGEPFAGVVNRVEDLSGLNLKANAPRADRDAGFLEDRDARIDDAAGGVGSGREGDTLVEVGFAVGF